MTLSTGRKRLKNLWMRLNANTPPPLLFKQKRIGKRHAVIRTNVNKDTRFRTVQELIGNQILPILAVSAGPNVLLSKFPLEVPRNTRTIQHVLILKESCHRSAFADAARFTDASAFVESAPAWADRIGLQPCSAPPWCPIRSAKRKTIRIRRSLRDQAAAGTPPHLRRR